MEPQAIQRYRENTAKRKPPFVKYRWCSRCRRGAFDGGRWVNFKFLCHGCITQDDEKVAPAA